MNSRSWQLVIPNHIINQVVERTKALRWHHRISLRARLTECRTLTTSAARSIGLQSITSRSDVSKRSIIFLRLLQKKVGPSKPSVGKELTYSSNIYLKRTSQHLNKAHLPRQECLRNSSLMTLKTSQSCHFSLSTVATPLKCQLLRPHESLVNTTISTNNKTRRNR